ncbi:MAG: hypothetical protein HWN65_21845, partial [Candidatus Helarchaeota archaeon]|nr:hypothetical protein [Candidatus Helarchaeota archaeon]
MRIKSSRSKNQKKLIILSLILGVGLLFVCFIGINSVTPSPAFSLSLEDPGDVLLSTQQVEPGNLTRMWEPVIITAADIPALTGRSWGNIRVVYYDPTIAEWVSVPFQIDEWHTELGWQDGQYSSLSPPIPSGVNKFVGPDDVLFELGMDSNFGGEDELVFYAHPGARVTPSMWWEGDAAGPYPNRIEVSLRDPIDNGFAWAYIYYEPGVLPIDHGDPRINPAFGKWVDYPPLGWDQSRWQAYGEYYNVSKNIINPDLEIDIRRRTGDSVNFVDETPKCWTNVTYTDLILFNNYSFSMAEGTWGAGIGATPYSDIKTELQSPDNPGAYYTEGGAGTPIVSGPIRTILNKRLFSNYTIDTTSYYIIDHETDFFYMDSKITNITRQIPQVPIANGTIDFHYDFVTSLDTSVRSDYVVYDGWVPEMQVRPNFPNGVPVDDVLISTSGPTGPNPKDPALANPGIPDFFFFTSAIYGSMWMYSPRNELIGTPSQGTYWRDDITVSEIGIDINDIQPQGALNITMKWKYMGSISAPTQARDVGIRTWYEFQAPLAKTFTPPQTAGPDALPPLIGPPVQVPNPAVNNASTSIYVTVTDSGLGDWGVHKVWLTYDNGTGGDTVFMQYYQEALNTYGGVIPQHPYRTNITYWIFANDTAGNPNTVGPFIFTVADPYPPPKVTGVTPTNLGIGNTLNVSWIYSPAYDVEGYLVWMSTEKNGTYNIQDVMFGRFNTSTIVSSLNDGDMYWFIVTAFDGVPWLGPNSTKEAGIPKDVTAPTQVQGVAITVIPTGNELNITWNDLSGTVDDLDHYNVYRAPVSLALQLIDSTNDTFYYDTGLTDGVTYVYQITAVDDGINPDLAPPYNEGEPSVAVNGTPQDTTDPAQVTGLQVFVIPEGDQLDLQWDDVNFTGDVDGYRIYRNTTISGFQLIDTTTDTWYNDTTVTNGDPYWYKVAAIDEVPNEGNYSTAVNGTPWDSVPPDPVTITPDPVAAIPAGKALNISWTANTSSDVAGYWIYNSTSEFGTYTLLTSVSDPTTYYVHSGLIDGQEYWYKVSAYDEVLNPGANTTAKKAIPTDETAPTQVQGVNVTVIDTGNELNITWTANSESDLLLYSVYSAPFQDVPINPSYWIANTTNTFHLDSGLTDGQIYWYKITAVDDGGPSQNVGEPSVAVNGTPQDTTDPAQVTGLQVFVIPEGDQLDLQWDDVNFTGDVDGYRIYRNTTISGFQLIDTTTDTWYNDTTVTNGDPYWYKVAAIDEVPNEGNYSTAVNGTPWDSVPPDPVTITPDPVAAIPAGKALNISWTANTSSDVAGYWIYNSTSEFGTYTLLTSVSDPTTYYVHSGLIDGQEYWYKVSAYDEVLNPGANTTAKKAIPTDETAPTQVQGVNVTVIDTGNELNITWTANSEPDLFVYRLYRSITSGFTPNQGNLLANVTHPQIYYLDSGLTDGTTYYYRITAVDDGGPVLNEGVASAEVNGTPQDTTAPDQVTGLQVFVVYTGNKLNLQWGDVNFTGDVKNYRIYRNSTISGFQLIATTPNTWHNDSGLDDGISYWYKVAAIDEVPNQGNFSAAVNGTPTDQTAPAQVIGLIVSNPQTGNQLDLSWTANSEIDLKGYTIWRRNSTSTYVAIVNTTKTDNYYNDTGLTDGETYYYMISAYDEMPNWGTNSSEEFNTPTDDIAPEKVTNLVVTNPHTGNTLNLGWTASTAPDFSHYRIYRNSTNIANLTGSTNNIYSDTTVTDGLVYIYEVSGVDDNFNEGTASDQANGTSDNTIPPAKVQDLVANKVGDEPKIMLNWTHNTEPDLLNYCIYRSEFQGFILGPSNNIANVSGTQNWYLDENGTSSHLPPGWNNITLGVKYYYRIKAIDTAIPGNLGEASDESSTTPGGIPPSQVTGLLVLVKPTGNALNIQWDVNFSEPDVIKYNVYRHDNPGFTIGPAYLITQPIGINYYNDTTDLFDGTTYYYKVTAVDIQSLEGPPSDEKNNTPEDKIAPEQVTGVGTTPILTGNTLNITWAPSSASDIWIYRVFRSQISGFSPSSDNNIANTTDPYYLDIDLDDDQNYYYRISAVDDGGPIPNEGLASEEVVGTPHDSTAPPQVTDFNVVNTGVGNTLNLTWAANPAPDLKGYRIYRSNVTGFVPNDLENLIATTNKTTYLDENLEDDKQYFYRIRAFDEVPNNGTASVEKSGIPSDTEAPPQVTGLSITNPGTGGKLELSWAPNPASDLSHYNVYRNGTVIATPDTNS